ncbi:MAG: MFS transporter [Pseudomonadota bacterium]
MPYTRLSSFYLFYFAVLGAMVPYWPVYLDSLDFTSRDIGLFMAVILGTKIIAPNLWGWLSDRSGVRMPWVRGGSLLGVAGFALVPWTDGFWPLLLLMLAYSFFWNAVLSQFEANTFNHLRGEHERYSLIRLWGSVGFIIAAVGLGPLLERAGIHWLPWLVLAGLAAIWLASMVTPEGPGQHLEGHEHTPLRRLLSNPAVLAFLGACLLMQASHGPYYTFFSLYMRDIGYSGLTTGILWGLGVGAEVVLFLIMAWLMRRFTLRVLLVASFVLAALRWIVIGLWPEQLGLLLFAQLLHAASFGSFHAAAIALVHRVFSGPNQGIGQALYSSLTFGAGGALGSLSSGLLWDGFGPTGTYLVAGGVAATGAALAAWAVVRLR